MATEIEQVLSQNNGQTIHNHYLFVDLETGGLYPKQHSILQVAAVLTDLDFNTHGYFMSYIKPHPELTVTKEALAINQLDWDYLQNAPEESFVAAALQQFALLRGKKGRFAGYNCQFDLEFLTSMWKRQSIENDTSVPYHVPWLDIYTCAKSKLGNNSGLPNFKLASVASYFGINTSGAHDALQDLFMTIEIAKQLKALPDREEATINNNLATAKFSIREEIIQVDNSTILTVETYTEEIAN